MIFGFISFNGTSPVLMHAIRQDRTVKSDLPQEVNRGIIHAIF